MALPNHPDTAYEFVKTLKDCGYQWVLVQEHTVERPENGHGPERKHLPHRLVCRNSRGEEAAIIAIIKTQGSDTKLVAQMQPYYEAKGLSRWELAGKQVPPLVTQIADGENGGVMMNEFPSKYLEVMREASGSDAPRVNVTEYLEYLFAMGLTEEDLPACSPSAKAHLGSLQTRGGPRAPGAGHRTAQKGRPPFPHGGRQLDEQYLLGARLRRCAGPDGKGQFAVLRKGVKPNVPTGEQRYRNALFHLLCSQTSCYRYWGQGIWTDYGREICRACRADHHPRFLIAV